MPKGSTFSDVRDYRSISIMPVLSKVFDMIVDGKLSNILEFFLLFSFHVVETWEHLMSYLHCLSVCRLLWTGAWREHLFSWSLRSAV